VAKPLSTAFLFSLILAAPAAAQTTATTGGVAGTTLANPYGAVTLRGTAAAPATAAAAPSSAASGAASAGGSGNGAEAGPGASVPAAALATLSAFGSYRDGPACDRNRPLLRALGGSSYGRRNG